MILLEAGCLEWALLIAVVLRDAMAVVRTVNTASMTDVMADMIIRMKEGVVALEKWADAEWCVFRIRPIFKTRYNELVPVHCSFYEQCGIIFR